MQYRITVNGDQGPVLNEHPQEKWTVVAQAIEDRGGRATLERRSVFEYDAETHGPLFLECLRDSDGNMPPGWMILPGKVISAWSVHAEIEVR